MSSSKFIRLSRHPANLPQLSFKSAIHFNKSWSGLTVYCLRLILGHNNKFSILLPNNRNEWYHGVCPLHLKSESKIRLILKNRHLFTVITHIALVCRKRQCQCRYFLLSSGGLRCTGSSLFRLVLLSLLAWFHRVQNSSDRHSPV